MKSRFALSLALLLMLIASSLTFAGSAICSSPYDVNGDGAVNILDILIWADAFGTFNGEGDFNPAVDLNPDGIIDIFDAVLISTHFGE